MTCNPWRWCRMVFMFTVLKAEQNPWIKSLQMTLDSWGTQPPNPEETNWSGSELLPIMVVTSCTCNQKTEVSANGIKPSMALWLALGSMGRGIMVVSFHELGTGCHSATTPPSWAVHCVSELPLSSSCLGAFLECNSERIEMTCHSSPLIGAGGQLASIMVWSSTESAPLNLAKKNSAALQKRGPGVVSGLVFELSPSCCWDRDTPPSHFLQLMFVSELVWTLFLQLPFQDKCLFLDSVPALWWPTVCCCLTCLLLQGETYALGIFKIVLI